MKNIVLSTLIITTSVSSIYGQKTGTISYSPSEVEALFLQQNLELIAERMNIDIADARIIQAKVWDNPNLSINNLNLWTTHAQRGGEKEIIAPVIGSFGRNTQFSIELSQMISLVRKRSKLVAAEKISGEMAVKQFEDLLRNLKLEIRKAVNSTIYLNAYLHLLEKQREALQQILSSLQKKEYEKNIAFPEIIRLQTAILETDTEIIQIKRDIQSAQLQIKNLISSDPYIRIHIQSSGFSNPPSLSDLSISRVIELANEHRPDLAIASLNVRYQKKLYSYEKAQRTPDLNLSLNYDRAGGVWKDFIGVGIGMDLPFFNQNKGAIRVAELSVSQKQKQAEQASITAINELIENFEAYNELEAFYTKINESKLFEQQTALYQNYCRNLINRNISMLEFMDFLESYKNSIQNRLSIEKELADLYESLQYLVGTDLNLSK